MGRIDSQSDYRKPVTVVYSMVLVSPNKWTNANPAFLIGYATSGLIVIVIK